MTKPIINPITEKAITALVSDLPQSLLITGEFGVGSGTIARYITDICKIKPIIILPEKDEKIDLEKGIIGVGVMRGLYDNTRTKSPKSRIFIIDYAERMNPPAQNAFLKLLEEPGEGVHFILVSNTSLNFLPTIMSRVTRLDIKPVTKQQTEQLFDDLGIDDAKKRAQLSFMASGLPAEINRLNSDEKYFEKRSDIIRDARELIIGTKYSKMRIAHKYKDDRATVLKMLLDMSKILKNSIISNPQPDAINKIQIILDTYTQIESNGNIRLSLANLALN